MGKKQWVFVGGTLNKPVVIKSFFATEEDAYKKAHGVNDFMLLTIKEARQEMLEPKILDGILMDPHNCIFRSKPEWFVMKRVGEKWMPIGGPFNIKNDAINFSAGTHHVVPKTLLKKYGYLRFQVMEILKEK